MGKKKHAGMNPEQVRAYRGWLDEFSRFKSTASERAPFNNVQDAFHLYLLGRYSDRERGEIIQANNLDIRLFQQELDAGGGLEIWPTKEG
jgi:hypothetical protein